MQSSLVAVVMVTKGGVRQWWWRAHPHSGTDAQKGDGSRDEVIDAGIMVIWEAGIELEAKQARCW